MGPNELPFRIGQVRFEGREGVPSWTISRFLELLSVHQMKMLMLQRVCWLKGLGVPDHDLFISAQSVSIYARKPIAEMRFKRYVEFHVPKTDSDEFWRIFRAYRRPVIYVREKSGNTPLFESSSYESVRLRELRERSPLDIVLGGALSGLVELLLASKRDRREEEAHANRQIEQSARNLGEIVRVSQLIDAPSTPTGVRRYANQMLDDLMNRQARINDAIRIREIHIDETN